MTNYQSMMEQMTPEKMAETNVRLVTVDNRRLFYMTSPGQLFPIDKFEDAVKFEYAWLNFDPEADKTDNEQSVEEACDLSEQN